MINDRVADRLVEYYHCLPEQYFDLQTKTGDWIPKYGAIWLAESDKKAFQASQHDADTKVIVRFELNENQVEEHSEMDICKRLNVRYYLYRGVIPKDKFSVWDKIPGEIK